MYPIDLSGKVAVIMGMANQRSLAWGVAEHLNRAGARLVFTTVGEKFTNTVGQLTEGFEGRLLYECNVQDDDQVDDVFARIGQEAGRIDMLVHSIAFANREDLAGAYVDTSREGFRTALEVSAFSLVRTARAALPLMKEHGGSIIAMSYLAAVRAVPRYNVMGTAKAALEQAVRQLSLELGEHAIRVNALSAGPVNTLSARGVRGFTDILGVHRERAPLKRNVTLDDVGGTALFLLSDLGSGVTGETIYVDGGYNIVGL
jgi:enoyl-[acyl-carrier protein] reductase I